MDERNATLYLAGMGFRIAESPEALVAAGTGVWNTPPHWPADDLEAITDAWPSSIGLAFGTGGAAARSDFENIRASFPAGARPAYNGQEAVILSCGRSPGRVVDGWYRVSITISWYALIPR